MSYLAAMENGFLEELQKIADARVKSADVMKSLKDFGTGAKAGAKGVIHAVKGAVKPGTSAITRGIVAGGAAVPAAAGVALGAGGTALAMSGKDKEKKAFAEKMLPGTERYYSDRMRSVLMGLAARVYTPEGA
jgi:hypothetical protein